MPRPNDTETSPKKGRPAWRPASKLEVVKKRSGYRYRWVDVDEANLDRKQKEGWFFVNKETGDALAEHERPDTVADGKSLDSSKKYRELVLMAMPEDMAQERDRYFAEQTDAQTRAIKDRLQEEIDDASGGRRLSRVHGKVVIE